VGGWGDWLVGGGGGGRQKEGGEAETGGGDGGEYSRERAKAKYLEKTMLKKRRRTCFLTQFLQRRVIDLTAVKIFVFGFTG
jgi:hypothetical protein